MLYEEIRETLFQTVLNCCQRDLIQLNSGNVSVRASAEHLIVTPRGIPYDHMTPEDLVTTDLNGSVIEGRHKPSSEMPTHLTIYHHMTNVAAVVHTHSPCALAFAVVGRSIPIICTEGLAAGGPVPVAQYAGPGTAAQGRVAMEAMQGPPSVTGVLLKNHGVLTIGASLAQAYATACRIEMAAKVYFMALQIGTPNVLTDEQIHEIRMTYSSKKSS